MKCPFDLTNKKAVIEFEEEDPFNPKNTLKGFVNRRQGHLYGSLWITHVNGKKCQQIIYGSPKQHYPFDKNDKWEFPECDTIYMFEKIDGTNIMSYRYTDGKKEYLTFKTRLRPFLGVSKFGNFYQLWCEMLEKYPQIKEMCFEGAYNFSFELYGKRNKILVEYDVPLDTKLIFAINKDGKIELPYWAMSVKFLTHVPILDPQSHIYVCEPEVEELKEKYLNIKNNLEKMVNLDEKTGKVTGQEGQVWYFVKNDEVKQIKNKPETILKFHWATDKISYESIYTTCVNAFENFDDPKYKDVEQLLLEEFEQEKINNSKPRINKILARVLFDKKLQFEIVDEYNKLGIDINKDKRTVMRHFGEKYPKELASKIYTLLMEYISKEVKE